MKIVRAKKTLDSVIMLSSESLFHYCYVRLMGEMVVADLASVSLDTERIISEAVARDGMRKVIAGIGSYPEFVQRCVRKHQLAAKLR